MGLNRLISSARRYGRSPSAASPAVGTSACSSRSARERHSAHAPRIIPTASQVRYPAPSSLTMPKATGLVWSSAPAPAAESAMSTASPVNTPAAALYPVRTPRRAATDSTYSEFGPGSKMISMSPTR